MDAPDRTEGPLPWRIPKLIQDTIIPRCAPAHCRDIHPPASFRLLASERLRVARIPS